MSSSIIQTLARALLGAAIVSTALTRTASAATVAGVTLPDTYTVDGQTLVLNGFGVRTLTIFSVRIYVAGLYLSHKSNDPKHIYAEPGPKVMLLEFLHSGSKADVEKEYRAGEAINCGDGSCAPSDQADFEHLIAAAPGVKVGDTSTYIYTPDGVRVLSNNQQIAAFKNSDLSYRLLSGFIGEHPPSADLRRHLLGLPDE